MKKHQGFTLIELVVVIVILGILAATALPKFMDLGKEARIASLDSLKGAITSAAMMVHTKCAASPGCNFVGQKSLTLNGVTRTLWYGWPIENSRSGVAWSVDQLVDYTGFTYTYTLGYIWAYFDRADAPTPSACRVSFKYHDSDTPPTVTVISTGC